MRVRVLYAIAGVLALLGLWLRLARSALPSPRADAAELPAPAAGRGAPAPAQQPPVAGYEAIAAANIFSQTRTAPSVRFVPVGQAAKRAAPDAFDYSFAGERRLKGFESRFKLYRVRRES